MKDEFMHYTSTSISPKRTRGPRSCQGCRSSKQRCEQLHYADIVPSDNPQPPEFACRRCRVLQLPCIISNELPKSTRMRMQKRREQIESSADVSRDLSQAGNAQGAYQLYTKSSKNISKSSPRFDPLVFDPSPVLESQQFDSPLSAINDEVYHDGHHRNRTMKSGSSSQPEWLQRAIIATRPYQLIEHLLNSEKQLSPTLKPPFQAPSQDLQSLIQGIVKTPAIRERLFVR